MTEEYRSKLISRISRLNYTNHIYVKRTALLVLLCVFALFFGYLSHFLFIGDKEGMELIFKAHFCGYFKGMSTPDSIRAVISFASPDFFAISAIMLLGYTMLSGIAGKLLLFLYSARLGWCLTFLFDFLINDPKINGGTSAFLLFAVCKLIIIVSLIFSALRSEDFSYRFGEIFSKNRHPYIGAQSIAHIKSMASTAGFTALINTIYLIFQSLSGFAPL